MSLLIVIPVRNEEARLAPGLALLAERLQSCGFDDYAVIVADNGSTDGTAALARASGDPRVSYLRACEQGDKGAAIAAGWAAASPAVSVLAYVDVDMATDPEALVRGFRLIAEGQADVVLGSRWDRTARVVGRSLRRAFLSAGLSLAWRLLPAGVVRDPPPPAPCIVVKLVQCALPPPLSSLWKMPDGLNYFRIIHFPPLT